MRRVAVGVLAVCGALGVTSVASARVLRVGTYNGIRGQFETIQAAVNAAKPGDWILIAPGDYKTRSSQHPAGRENTPAGVLISTPNVHVRGMNRNTVIVDGTQSGPRCSRNETDQNLGPAGSNGGARLGLNGIMVWKADNVWVQNLTACNFLSGAGSAGNEIWWNGGDGSGKVGGWGFYGSYLNATSTFYKDEHTAAAYGIFSSNWSGGTWDQTYASNFNDSGYYIGACQQVCDQTVNHAWAEYSALGYSGSNSGGQLVVENSEFDKNKDGFDTNSQNGDNPPPQDGSCPSNGISKITHTHSCWVFMHNYVHDNNNPNVPEAGSAAAGPVGTGVSVSGGRDDTIMNNRFVNNKAWGVIFVPYPDMGDPCTGGTQTGASCWYDDWGNAVINNTFSGNGGYHNDTNGDIAEITTFPGHAINCYRGNTDTSGTVTSSPSGLQQTNSNCGQTAAAPDPNPSFTNQVACDSQFFASLLPTGSEPCTPGSSYPRHGASQPMPPLPTKQLQSMPNPCAGVPANPWCPAPSHRRR